MLVRHGELIAVREVDLSLQRGQIGALMGRNGSGKSSLLWALQGSGPRQAGSVAVRGADPKRLPAAEARRLVGLVPQTPSDLLYLDTVAAELVQADRESGRPPVRPGSCSTGWPPASPASCIRATSPPASSCRWCWPSN